MVRFYARPSCRLRCLADSSSIPKIISRKEAVRVPELAAQELKRVPICSRSLACRFLANTQAISPCSK